MGLRLQPRMLLTLFFAGAFAYAVIEAADMPIQARLYPWVVGGVALALLAWQLIRELLPRGDDDGAARPTGADLDFTEEEASRAGRRRALELFGWLYGFAALLWLIGFFLAIPLMVGLYLARSRESALMIAALAGGAGLATWLIFGHFLHLPFPPGLLVELAGLD